MTGTDASVELAYSGPKDELADWCMDNLTQMNTQLLDVLSSWGKFRHVEEFIQGLQTAESGGDWSWAQSLTDLAEKQADAYKTGAYKFLIPLEYEIWWCHDRRNFWWLLTFWSEPPRCSYYYDSILHQHWALVNKHKKAFLGRAEHAPEALIREVVRLPCFDSQSDKQDLFLGRNGWDIGVYEMVHD